MASRHRKQSTKLNYYSLKVSHNCKSSLCHIIKFLVSLVILLYQKINDANWMTDQLSLIDNSVSAACSWSKILEGMGSAMSQKLHHLWILHGFCLYGDKTYWGGSGPREAIYISLKSSSKPEWHSRLNPQLHPVPGQNCCRGLGPARGHKEIFVRLLHFF